MKNLSKFIFFLVIVFNFSFSIAQGIAINEDGSAPDTNAILELKSSDKGLILPRVALTSTSSPTPLDAHVEGMTVYNTSSTNDLVIGVYFNDGTRWIPSKTKNIYNASDSLTNNRTVETNGYQLVFDGENQQTIINEGLNQNATAISPDGEANIQIVSPGSINPDATLTLQTFTDDNAQILAGEGADGLIVGTDSNSNSAPIRFHTSDGGGSASTEKARITGEGNVGIGTTNPGSNLSVNGSAGYNVTERVADYNIANDDYFVFFKGGSSSTFTLPIGASGTCNCEGRIYKVINKSDVQLNLVTQTGETIDTTSNITIEPGFALKVVNVNKVSGETWSSVSYGEFQPKVTETSGSETKKIQVRGAYDPSLIVQNGPFEFRMVGTGGGGNNTLSYQIRPIEDPSGTVVLTYANVFRWGGVGGNTPGATNGTLSFDSSDWTVWKSLEPVTTSLNGHNMMLSIDTSTATNTLFDQNIFYNLIVQRIGDNNGTGLKTLIINRY